jgi:GTP-binding protein Era
MNSSDKIPGNFKSGYVALIGTPNAGKSTLLNRMLDEKLAIVTPKPQTTRFCVPGILNGSDYQLILLDTPGLIAPRYLMQKKMMEITQGAIRDADLVAALLDGSQLPGCDKILKSWLDLITKPKVLIINKIDIIETFAVDDIGQLVKLYSCQEGVRLSARTGEGIDTLLPVLLKYVQGGFPYYPVDQLSSEPERFFVSELIREQLILRYGEEVPYAANVQVVDFKERHGKKDFIQAIITVEKDSQKAIIIGRHGHAIKSLGQESREAAEKLLGRPVYLELSVRVRKKWRKDSRALREMGFE